MAHPISPGIRETGATTRVVAHPSPLRATPPVVVWLAILALVTQALDLVSAIRMISTHGLRSELNPVAHAIIALGGLAGLSVVKLGVIVAAVLLFVWVGRYGRARLAAVALSLAAAVGAFGYYSNQI
jgi:hypothetical protein